MDLDQLRTILTTPDNVPIVLLLLVAPFYTWYGLRQALANDRLIAQLEADPEMAKSHHRKTQAWRPEWAREVHVWPPRRGAPNDAKPVQIVTRHIRVDHLDCATGQPEGHRPKTAGASPVHDFVDVG